MILVTVIWAVSEYHNAGGWPTSGFSQSSGIPNVWNYRIIYPFIVWVLGTAAGAWFVFGRKPISEDEIKREIGREAGPPRWPLAECRRNAAELLPGAGHERHRRRQVGEMPLPRRGGIRHVAPGPATTSTWQVVASGPVSGPVVAGDDCADALALSIGITVRLVGPRPMTIAAVPLPTSPLRTACHATAIGSVSAAITGTFAPGSWGVMEQCRDYTRGNDR